MHQVSIDFVAGSHGHFLEYVCNKFIARQDIAFSPFTSLGSSHAGDLNQQYLDNRTFVAYHFSEFKLPLHKKIVKISFTNDDLLPLSSISLLRAGDYNISNNELEIDTFTKLNNSHYKGLIEGINASYPNVNLSESNRNCPRYILREYFKFGFMDPANHGLMLKLSEFKYSSDNEVFDFSFKSFYNKDNFLNSITELAAWYGSSVADYDSLIDIWEQFYSKQIYKDHKSICDKIIENVNLKNLEPIPGLTLFQESYINAQLEKIYHIEMPFMQDNYFSFVQQVISYISKNV